ncbi:HupE/UreJ family protein [Oscillatoria sp. HE19RPO]|uniref:HupE/UreJ family protein n=1 Tax=Oscillatoria sp. HE19RPO TaxID=2954806 RepID=UPI0020C506F6|nr:HupE/UreJ family protein [Oscillatoria sp. HE19RPO]
MLKQTLNRFPSVLPHHPRITGGAIIVALAVALFWGIEPAFAHHPMGSATPSNFWEGLLSGFAHPIIGLDHFAFVVAIALLSAFHPYGIAIPITFAIAAMGGTGIHLLTLDIPAVEIIIAASVLTVGTLLGMKERPNLTLVAAIAAVAGIFHGYAYGEAIIGAETAPLLAYLIGFTAIQIAIASAAIGFVRKTLSALDRDSNLSLRFAGFAIGGIGAAFLASSIVG